MKIVRNIFSWLSLYLVGSCFFLAANAFVIVKILEPDAIKQTLHEQGTYSKVVPTVLSSAKYTGNSDAGTIPLDQPWVKDIANKAFTADDIEQQGDTVIDSVFAWLDGTTNKPEFKIDLTANKQKLADETGSYVTNRLSNLPACSLSSLPTTVDPYRIECLPPGISPSVVGKSVTSDVSGDQSFLKDPVISSNNSAIDTSNAKTDSLRTAYQHKNLAIWLLPILTILLSVIGVLLATNRRKALERLAHSFLFSAIGLGAIVLFITFGAQMLVKAAAKDAVTRDILGPLVVDLMKQARVIYLIFAIIAVALTIVLRVLKRFMKKPGHNAPTLM